MGEIFPNSLILLSRPFKSIIMQQRKGEEWHSITLCLLLLEKTSVTATLSLVWFLIKRTLNCQNRMVKNVYDCKMQVYKIFIYFGTNKQHMHSQQWCFGYCSHFYSVSLTGMDILLQQNFIQDSLTTSPKHVLLH